MTTLHRRILFTKYEYTVAGAQFTIRTSETQLKGVKSIFAMTLHPTTEEQKSTSPELMPPPRQIPRDTFGQ
jgi:hypothetical protein